MSILTQLTTVLFVVVLSSSSVVKSPASDTGAFELLILHNNDMHARFEQTSQVSGVCTTEDRELGQCYGGFPRVAHVVKEARRAALSGEGPPVLYLNAGDTYTGTAWFTIYKWKIAAEFINALQPDAVSLGNNELDDNDKLLFINSLDTKILASNVILTAAKGNQNVQKFVIFDIKGTKVGIVGYLTPDAAMLAASNDIDYIDEIIALKEEVTKLQAQNVNIIIALGHSNLNKDLEIAREVEGLDLVITGHKNMFNWDGTTREYPSTQEAIIVNQYSGRKVPLIQAAAYNKYLGQVTTTFNEDGEITDCKVNPILLDSLIPQDTAALKLTDKIKTEVSPQFTEPLGNTTVVLDGESCKTEECNLGNLIADSMMYYHAINYQGNTVWTDAPIAIIHSGAIAGSIAPSNRPAAVSLANLLSALPQESYMVAITMNGTVLNQVLEQSVAEYSIRNPTGQLLQYSGVRVQYDLARDPGSRIVDAVVRCGSCYVPEFYVIDSWRNYTVLMPAALADGEFGYNMFTGLNRVNLPYDEITCAADFITRRSPVYPELAGRIVLNNVDAIVEPEPDSATAITSTILLFALLPITMF
ncbi:hypothetical protein K1T71_009844 [Dendrolimus kikuchii]|uniref:Uncharacterized protein n=1 Tax=Dendrolimus kikuchii TaxID=765133 RepID=A0ACC1CSU8_9NEOP|nr:hypothetical protein K1T71_009844 [Dendrolimus kikuchii]